MSYSFFGNIANYDSFFAGLEYHKRIFIYFKPIKFDGL